MALAASTALAQSPVVSPGSFVIKGSTTSVASSVMTDEGRLDMALTTLFKNSVPEIPVNAAGEFNHTLPITGPCQNIYLYLPDRTLNLFVCPGDTVTFTFDGTTPTVSVNDPARTREMQLSMRLEDGLGSRLRQLTSDSYHTSDAATDTLFLKSIIKYIRDYTDSINTFERTYGRLPNKQYMLLEGYFKALRLVARDAKALQRLTQLGLRSPFRSAPLLYKESDSRLLVSPAYRSFINTYVNELINPAVNAFNTSPDSSDDRWIARDRMMRHMVTDSLTADWLSADNFMTLVNLYPFDKVKPFADYITATLTVPEIKASVDTVIADKQMLMPGQPAPKLTLRGIDGKHYTLDSFKGRIVYLDLWGVGCAPCISEFKAMAQLKESLGSMARHVAFVTVCCWYPSLDSWRNVCRKHEVDAINTILDKQASSAIYDVSTYPTYVLIDPDGKIISFGADRPSLILKYQELNVDNALSDALRRFSNTAR